MCIWAVATIIRAENYYNLGILDGICWNGIRMIKLITYHYMEKRVARGAVEKKINPETSFVFVYYGMLQRRSCLDICNSTSQVMLEVFSSGDTLGH